MSTYFDFTIERPYRNEWICVGQSFYDENLDVINPWILKSAFWDADFSEDINSVTNITDTTFCKFANKINHDDYSDWYVTDVSSIGEDVLKFLDRTSKTRLLCNDICLWFDAEYIIKQTDFLKSFLHLKRKDDNLLEKWNKFVKILEGTKNIKEFRNLLGECDNVIIQGDFIGIIFNDSAYSLGQIIKYTPIFKNIQIHHADVLGYSEVKDNGYTDERKQYELRGHVSYKKDIEYMISEIDKTLVRIENSKKSEEIAKSYIAGILEDYEYDEDVKNNELYKRLYEYSKDSEEYDDEYDDELIAQKYELELIVRFIGDNGRIIWNIE